MSRPAPGVLFAHSFVHHRLGEHVDEVRFAEPVVISACEILESNASSSCSSISLKGRSTPQSFAAEFFIRIGGENRFKRLCPAFVYSTSASNSVNIQAAVTNYLVLRGFYRAVTLVIYGNPVKDLGKFGKGVGGYTSFHNPELLDGGFFNSEDLPEALCDKRERSLNFTRPAHFCLVKPNAGLAFAVRQLLELTVRVWRRPFEERSRAKLSKALLLASLSLIASQDNPSFCGTLDHVRTVQNADAGSQIERKCKDVIMDATEELQELLEPLPESKDEDSTSKPGEEERQPNVEVEGEVELDFAVVEMIFDWLQADAPRPLLSVAQSENLLGALAAAELLCFDRQGCFHFVLCGGTHLLFDFLQTDAGDAPGVTLLVLRVLDHVSQYAFGCESLLEWWQPVERRDSFVVGRVYVTLLQMLLQPQRHSVGRIITRILYRLRVYELAATFQSVVEDLLVYDMDLRDTDSSTRHEKEALQKATVALNKLQKLLNLEDAIEEQGFNATQLLLSDAEELTNKLLPSTAEAFSQRFCCHDMDPTLLSLLQERRFMPSLALLVLTPSIRNNGVSPDFVVAVEDLLLALIGCRSGLAFLGADPEAASSLVVGLCGMEDFNETNSAPLQLARSLMPLGMLFQPKDVGCLLHTSISVVSLLDQFISTSQGLEASVWALWELVTLCRLETGRQAFLALCQFPEAFTGILEAISPDVGPGTTGLGELKHAISHLASELLLMVIIDSGDCAMATWVSHAATIQRVLQASAKASEDVLSGNLSGTNDKIILGPRLLELVEPALVYQERGPTGLLRYCAALIAGGQNSIMGLLLSEGTDADNPAGDLASVDLPDIPTLLGKGVAAVPPALISDIAVMQLTIGLQILASVSSSLGVATALYGEGAMTVLVTILEHGVTCLRAASDDAFDIDMESDGAFEDMPESGSERLTIKLLLPVLAVVLNLLKKLQLTIEEYRNTKLVDVLLRLNCCISAKAMTYSTVPPFSWGGGALELHAARRVLASVLICWPIFGWTPAILPRLLGVNRVGGAVPSNISSPMDPIEACSVFSLLGDMLPVEQPLLCASEFRTQFVDTSLALAPLFGVGITPEVDWHFRSSYEEKFLRALFPHLEQLADIILHYIPTTCAVLQDMVKSLVVRVGCRQAAYCGILLRPVLGFIKEHTAMDAIPSENEKFLVEHFLQFISGLMVHPATKVVLMKEGIMEVLQQAICLKAPSQERIAPNEAELFLSKGTQFKWILTSFFAACNFGHSLLPFKRCLSDGFPRLEECCFMASTILDLVEIMPFTKDLIVLVELIQRIAGLKLGRVAFAIMALRRNYGSLTESTGGEMSDVENIPSSQTDAREAPGSHDASKSKTPLLNLWKRLAVQVEIDKTSNTGLLDIVQQYALVAISLTAGGRSTFGLGALKLLFGLDISDERECEALSLECISSIVDCLRDGLESTPGRSAESDSLIQPSGLSVQAYIAVTSMLRLLKKPANFSQLREKLKVLLDDSSLSPDLAEEVQAKQLPSMTAIMPVFSSRVDKTYEVHFEKGDITSQEASENVLHTESKDFLIWECCTIMPDRPIVSNASKKRSSLSGDIGSKRHRADGNAGLALDSSSNIVTGAGSNLRSGGASGASAGLPNRRDAFRQRKPNTSRPPSMHVDDYVARERGSDAVTAGSGSSGPSSIQRGGSSSGRPPSIHVDEFMARQRERQHSLSTTHASSASQHSIPSTGADNVVSKGVEAQLQFSKDGNDKENDLIVSGHNSQVMQMNTDLVSNLTAAAGPSGTVGNATPNLPREESGMAAQFGGPPPDKIQGRHGFGSSIPTPGSFVGINEELDHLYPEFHFLEKESLDSNIKADFESPSSKLSEEPQQTIRSKMRHQKGTGNRTKLTEPATSAKEAGFPTGPIQIKSSSPITAMSVVGMPSQSSMAGEKGHLLTSASAWMSSSHQISETGTSLTKLAEETGNSPYTSSSMLIPVPHPPPPSGQMMVLPSPPKDQPNPFIVAPSDAILQSREHKVTPGIPMPAKAMSSNVFTPLAVDQRPPSAPLPLQSFESHRSVNSLAMQPSAIDRSFSTDTQSEKTIRPSMPPAPPPLPPPLPPLPPPSTGWLPADPHVYRPDPPLPITSVPMPPVSLSSIVQVSLATSVLQHPSSDRNVGPLQSSGALGSVNVRLFEDMGPSSRSSIRVPHFPPLPPLSSPPLVQNSVQASTHMPLPVSNIFPYTGGSMPVEGRPAYGLSSAPQPPPDRVSTFPFSPGQIPPPQSFSLPAPFVPPVPAGRPTSSYSTLPSTSASPQLQQQPQLTSTLSLQQLQSQQFQQQNQQQSLQPTSQPSLLLPPQQQTPKVDVAQHQFQHHHQQMLQSQEKFQLPQDFSQPQQLPQPQQVRGHLHPQHMLHEQLHSQQQQSQERSQDTGSSLHSLQQMLASPDAIQELLKDQNKLRQLLEQHPKLISLLQEKLNQGSS